MTLKTHPLPLVAALAATLTFALPTQAAPVVVQPGEAAGYMYFPSAPAAASGGSTSIQVTVSSTPTVANVADATKDAGACASVTTPGQTCKWSDGSSVIYAGTMTGGKKLFAAPTDESTSMPWGCYGTSTGANSSTDGIVNSNRVLSLYEKSGCLYSGTYYPPTAHQACQGKGVNYYLPARDELKFMWDHRGQIGSFSIAWYWTSTEVTTDIAWSLHGENGGFYSTNYPAFTKAVNGHVRCARSF